MASKVRQVPIPPQKHELKIYLEGKIAYSQDKGLKDCHHAGHDAEIWRHGWMDAYVENK